MDYEKKYNEAIERMRKMLGPWRELAYNGKSFLQDLESIFHELRESEDERMMKNIRLAILSVEDAFWRTHGLTAKEAISYLEKQKELTPADGWDYADKRMSHPLYLEGFEAGRAVEREASEKKPDWSEEDKDKVAQYLHDRDGGMLWSKATEITSDILDILRPQPAEWSEEDEKMIWDIVAVLEADIVENKKKFPYALSLHEQYKKMVAWLKSLRPQSHWKPSEEQMKALEKTIYITNYGCNPDRINALSSLYGQLKKL